MDYRTHQRRLLPALAKTYALAFAQQRLVDELHAVFTDEDADDRSRRQLETLAAGVKAVATWHASETIQSCREACGGAGYLRTSRFAALKADTDVFTTFEGDNTVLLQLAAKNLLTDYKDAFGELDPLGMAQFVAGQALGRADRAHAAAQVRPTAATCARATRSSTSSAGATSTCSRAPRGGSSGAWTPGATRSPCSSTARTTCSKPPARGSTWWCSSRSPRTRRSIACAACTRCTRSRPSAATTSSTGGLSGGRSKEVIKTVNALCAELRPDAGALVEAFGVPENVLTSRERVAA